MGNLYQNEREFKQDNSIPTSKRHDQLVEELRAIRDSFRKARQNNKLFCAKCNEEINDIDPSYINNYCK